MREESKKGKMPKEGNKQIIISFKGWWEKRVKRKDAQGGVTNK